PLHQRGEITNLELTKIVAVARLVTRPKQSMNVHEPEKMALLAGVNQLYAEIGINPRDCSLETQTNRGYSVLQVADMLRQVGYQTKGSEEC
ncbi:MAG: radical SAM protein, partial [Lachnospiraceae bacterium]